MGRLPVVELLSVEPPNPSLILRRPTRVVGGLRSVMARTSVIRSGVRCFGILLLGMLHGACDSHESAVSQHRQHGDFEAGTVSFSPGSGQETEDCAFIGVVVPRERVDVAAESEGKLAGVAVQLGARVPQGGVIATLDPRNVKVQLAEAQASLEEAGADLEQKRSRAIEAGERLQRRRALAQALSTEVLSEAEVNAKVAAAERAAAGARVKQLETRVQGLQQRLADTVVRAPFAGVVAIRYVDPGGWVDRGTPLVSLMSTDQLVRFAVPEPEIDRIDVGGPVMLTVADAASETAGRQILSATVLHIAPEVDSASGMIIVEAELQKPSALTVVFRSGGVIRVTPFDNPAAGEP